MARIIINCSANYNQERQSYEFYGEWTLDNPLAQEAITNYRTLIRHFLPAGAISFSVPNTDRNIMGRNTTYQLPPLRESEYGLTVRAYRLDANNNDFYYRRSLVPRFMTEFPPCLREAPPVPPNPVQNVSIVNASYIVMGSDDVYEFIVEWEPPAFSDGQLEEYLVEILDLEEVERPSVISRQESIAPTETRYDATLRFNRAEDISDILTLRMTARNVFQLSSEPTDILLNLSAIRDGFIITEAPMESSSFPLYGVVLIAVAAAIVLALISTAEVIILCILYSRYERSKY